MTATSIGQYAEDVPDSIQGVLRAAEFFLRGLIDQECP